MHMYNGHEESAAIASDSGVFSREAERKTSLKTRVCSREAVNQRKSYKWKKETKKQELTVNSDAAHAQNSGCNSPILGMANMQIQTKIDK